MDPLFARFERLVRSMFQEDEERYRGDPFGRDSFRERRRGERDYIFEKKGDRDFREAWEELDQYLHTGSSSASSADSFVRAGGARPRPLPPRELRKDYDLLGVSFGAPFEEVRRAYRSLIRTHHPDVHGADKGATDRATSRSQEINESFQRIKTWVEGSRTG